MKIFVLTSRFPYPLEKGDKLRIYHQIRYLSAEHEIILCALSESAVAKEYIKELETYCSHIHVLRTSKMLSFLRAIFAFVVGGSLQINYFYNRIKAIKVRKLVFQHKPDHIYCQLIRMAEYVKDLNHVSKTIDYMDAFSIGMGRQAEDSPFPLNYIFKEEAQRLSQYEAEVFYDFDLCTIISEQDRDYIKTNEQEKIQIIRNGVDTDTFSYLESTEHKDIDALFVGNMSYYPNVKAAEYLAEHVFATMAKKHGGFKLTIAGANPAPQLQKMNIAGIEVLGWVDDIVDVYHRAKIFVAPLFHGSGLQNKILEAMACGVPVITTTQTNNAIKAKPGLEILLADSADEFISQMHLLQIDEQLYQNLQKNACKFVIENYSWASFVGQLNQAILET